MLLAAAAMSVGATACSRSGATVSDHGAVVGHLAIPFRPPVAKGPAEIIEVTVRAGRRFSIEVDTSDGPQWWTQIAAPDSRLLTVVGDFNLGSCPADVTGCRVPYYHTLLARSPGETTMTWKYNSGPCRAQAPAPTASQAASPTASPASKLCPSATKIQFDIDVR